MTKKFFVKYLPTSEPLKEGFCVDECGEVSYYKNYYEQTPKQLKNARLYLCSYDIANVRDGQQLWGTRCGGWDTLIIGKRVKKNDSTYSRIFSEGEEFPCYECFIPIGEVSKEAVQVSTSDVFDETDVIFQLKEGDLAGRDLTLQQIKAFVGSSYSNVLVKIKCKCCGTFK